MYITYIGWGFHRSQAVDPGHKGRSCSDGNRPVIEFVIPLNLLFPSLPSVNWKVQQMVRPGYCVKLTIVRLRRQ